MNRLLVLGLVVLLAGSAHAGGNPGVRIYIDFDPPNYMHSISPEPYSDVEAYICLDNLGIGMINVSFALTDLEAEYPGLCNPPSFTRLLVGSLPT
jgi:hypothetical protein